MATANAKTFEELGYNDARYYTAQGERLDAGQVKDLFNRNFNSYGLSAGRASFLKAYRRGYARGRMAKSNPLPIPKGKWVKVNKVKVNPNGSISMIVPSSSLKKTNPARKRRNVAAGFYDEDGYFHPLRASFDYSRSRAGEKPKAKKRKKAKAKRKR